jgi:hypothetical protein
VCCEKVNGGGEEDWELGEAATADGARAGSRRTGARPTGGVGQHGPEVASCS